MTTGSDWESTSLEAHRLVFGPRNATYDHPSIDYGRTAELFSALTGVELSTREAICFMVCVKLSRISAAMQHEFPADMVRDSIVDLAGYADCLYGVWESDQDLSLDELLDQIERDED
jgi:hypothetical protein